MRKEIKGPAIDRHLASFGVAATNEASVVWVFGCLGAYPRRGLWVIPYTRFGGDAVLLREDWKGKDLKGKIRLG